MKIIVLGSAAGGGFPQWNCNCRNCDGCRKGKVRAFPRTQSSIAVSGNGIDWLLINASPDILAQIRATPALQPNRAARDTGIAAVLLMDAQIDHVTGLLMLREGRPLALHCTAPVWDELNRALPLAPVLSHYCGVNWRPLSVDEHSEAIALDIPGFADIRMLPIALSSKAPPYSLHRTAPQPGDNIGLLIEDRTSGKKAFYAPGLGRIEPHVEAALRKSDCVLVDGTFWTEDELIRCGFSAKTAADMGHLPISGPGGMLACLDALEAKTKVLIHINNTNPILDEDSEQRSILTRHGVQVAFDGMEIAL
ncbi:MAG TPA: pyrroloquinoline quinone biosynthesis protein PqqB [Noviherbaspirillum sp.]